jgi:hypothetical protein
MMAFSGAVKTLTLSADVMAAGFPSMAGAVSARTIGATRSLTTALRAIVVYAKRKTEDQDRYLERTLVPPDPETMTVDSGADAPEALLRGSTCPV